LLKTNIVVTNPEKYLQFIGSRITEIRRLKGISQYKLAKNVMMEQSNLARIEKGLTNPTIKTLLKISDALEVQLEVFFSKKV
jgi:transcriptional regulator with XRE-family HTH domain